MSSKLVSQDHITYPLNIGDYWQYHVVGSFDEYHSIEVLGDTTFTANGKSYKSIRNRFGGKSYVRFSEDKVYYFDTGLQIEKIQYDFTLSRGDTVAMFTTSYDDTPVITLVNIGYKNIFGSLRKQWSFLYDWLHTFDDEVVFTITDSIGLTSSFNIWDQDTLYSAIINGKLYGTIVHINENNLGYDKNLNLIQNYPNPSNAITTIKFQIPELSFVTLKVYDVLGNEITTIVNEEKPAGNYVMEFDATGLPSGIYFYQFKVGDFVKTKKMVIMK